VHHAHQRRLIDGHAVLRSVETPAQLLEYIAVRAIQFQRFAHQRRLTPDHLHRVLQPSQNSEVRRMSWRWITFCKGLGEAVQALLVGKRELRLQHIRIALGGGQVMKEDAGLQRRQRVNVLHIGHAAGDAGDDAVDARLVERHQWQQLGE
jgi:hypothetical protein